MRSLIAPLGWAVEWPFAALQRRISANRMAYVFAGPNLLVFAIFVVAPMILNIWYALTGGTELLPGQRPFVGGANFSSLLACGNYLHAETCRQDRFWRAVWNTVVFVICQVGVMVSLSLITALVLNRRIPARGFFRAVFFYPVLLSPVVVALIWKWILQPSGLLNALVVGAGGQAQPFLLAPGWSFFWTVVVSIWAHMGFYTLILLAGLQAIPRDLYEAAEMDGTPRWRVFRRITLPLLMPSMLVVLVLGLIRAVQAFDEIYVLTGGGPGTATQYLVQYIYETAFANQIHILGLAAAASMLVGGVLLVLTLLQLAVAGRART
ncbi:MAG: sugar ABC transporter permease [Rhodospirillales bacterium]|nr:sugar ABC transporter permease [Rhodospirillales bacterium]MDE2198319.1 sugar ABC transporter permease [Rhodospirillales bacterium]MDE2576315.1 sugar ABC transporter permease [Rhodospirillales bacterium]